MTLLCYVTHSKWRRLGDVLEPVLAGTAAAGATPADIVAAAAAARVGPQCNDPATGLDAEVGLGDPGRNVKYTGFGATAEAATATENSEQGCPTRYALDDSKMDCSGDTCLAVRKDATARNSFPTGLRCSTRPLHLHRPSRR